MEKKMRNPYKIVVGIPEGKRPLRRPRCRCDSIRTDVREMGWGVNWVRMAQDRDQWRALLNTVMNLRVL